MIKNGKDTYMIDSNSKKCNTLHKRVDCHEAKGLRQQNSNCLHLCLAYLGIE